MKQTLTFILCIVLLLGTLCTSIIASDEQDSLADTTETTTVNTTEASTAGTTETATQGGEFSQTTLPEKATYLFVNSEMGIGGGEILITMPAQSNATSFALYWGDSVGYPLDGCKPFFTGKLPQENQDRYTQEGFSIPSNAKTILLYTYSEQYGRSALPFRMSTNKDTKYGTFDYTLPKTGQKLADLVIVSDLLIGSGKTADENLITMLNDVKNTAPDAKGIIVVGDAVYAADEAYYAQLAELCAQVPGAPTLYCGIGDRSYRAKDTYKIHDPSKYAADLQLFLKYLKHPSGTKPTKPYYSYMLGGTLMVFIGADSYQNENAEYSKEQLSWLDGVLAGVDKNEPVFIFMHEPLPNTVSGSYESQGYGNVFNHEEVKNILKKYSNAIIFNGHTQWDLELKQTMGYVGNNTRAYNTASVANLCSDKDGGSGIITKGSQGYYVTIYEDAVLIRGRDFASGEWIPNAFYMFSTKPTPVQGEQTTEAPKPSATTAKPAEEETTEAEEESSMRDLLLPVGILGCMAIVVFIFIFRKPKEQP